MRRKPRAAPRPATRTALPAIDPPPIGRLRISSIGLPIYSDAIRANTSAAEVVNSCGPGQFLLGGVTQEGRYLAAADRDGARHEALTRQQMQRRRNNTMNTSQCARWWPSPDQDANAPTGDWFSGTRWHLACLSYIPAMAPTVVRDGQFRLFFFSREEPRIHVHVAHPDGEAKFWLTPEVSVATVTGLSPRQLREARAIVEAHIQEVQDAWNRHFRT